MFKRTHYITGLYSCLVLLCIQVKAQPSFASSQIIGDHKVYRDVKLGNVFYYMPFDYKLVTDASGKPDFSMIQMRYTGTRATADAGVAKFNNLLQFRVAVDPQQQKKVSDLKTALRNTYPAAELRPLPVRKFSSLLVFAGTGTGAEGGTDSLYMLKTNYAEATDENAASNKTYWNDRVVTLRLNNIDAQLVETALQNKQSAMSFSYVIYSVFVETDPIDLNVYGNKDIRKQVKDYFESEVKNKKDSALRITMVKADAINLNVNLETWPALIQKIDINEKMPAKYPLFDVYCYDFNNELRPDLFAKKIEIKATSVNGTAVLTTFYFKENQPELYAKSIRFPYAIRFDKPFYYRVTEITRDGEATISEWKEKKEWSEILDITSPPDKVIVKPKEDDQ